MPLKCKCPRCGKLHRNIDKKFLGKKFQCECGKVMRLGSAPKKPPEANPVVLPSKSGVDEFFLLEDSIDDLLDLPDVSEFPVETKPAAQPKPKPASPMGKALEIPESEPPKKQPIAKKVNQPVAKPKVAEADESEPIGSEFDDIDDLIANSDGTSPAPAPVSGTTPIAKPTARPNTASRSPAKPPKKTKPIPVEHVPAKRGAKKPAAKAKPAQPPVKQASPATQAKEDFQLAKPKATSKPIKPVADAKAKTTAEEEIGLKFPDPDSKPIEIEDGGSITSESFEVLDDSDDAMDLSELDVVADGGPTVTPVQVSPTPVTPHVVPQAQPVQAIPVQPVPVQPVPVQPVPVKAVPVQAVPVQAIPVQPIPIQAVPVPVQPVPVQPVPAQPVYIQPVAQSVPVQPTATSQNPIYQHLGPPPAPMYPAEPDTPDGPGSPQAMSQRGVTGLGGGAPGFKTASQNSTNMTLGVLGALAGAAGAILGIWTMFSSFGWLRFSSSAGATLVYVFYMLASILFAIGCGLFAANEISKAASGKQLMSFASIAAVAGAGIMLLAILCSTLYWMVAGQFLGGMLVSAFFNSIVPIAVLVFAALRLR